MAPHADKTVLHRLEIVAVAPRRGQAGRGWLHDQTKLEQAADQLLVRLAHEGPRQHIGIEQVPALPWQHARASFGPAFHQPLGGQDLNGFTIGAAGYVEGFGKGYLSGQRVAGRELPREDRNAKPVRDRAPQPPSRIARRTVASAVALPRWFFCQFRPLFCIPAWDLS